MPEPLGQPLRFRSWPICRCIACGHGPLVEVVDLGVQPYANSYHHGETLPRAPLVVNRCMSCTHCQLSEQVDPELLFGHYLYESGTTSTLRTHFDHIAAQLASMFPRSIRLLDIACNDGTFMEAARSRGCHVVGVDPAENLCKVAAAKGLDVVCGYWPQDHVVKQVGEVDVVVAFNVLAHVVQPDDFLLAAAEVLRPDGVIVTMTSQCHWLERGEFDYWYHEHLSAFSQESMRALARRVGLQISHFAEIPVHGGSLYALMRAPYASMRKRAVMTALDLREAVDRHRAAGATVLGYGAAAKGNTLLNFAQVKLDAIVDDNPRKVGFLTPGMDIPIDAPEALLSTEQDVTLVLLAWNFAEEIKRKVLAIRGKRSTWAIYPFPTVREEKWA